MKTTTRFAAFSLALVSSLCVASAAHALEESTRGPFYIQGTVLGFASLPGINTGCGTGIAGNYYCTGLVGGGTYRVGAEFGWHPSGRHDGFVVGVRQTFYLGGGSFGSTQARLGFDIPIPVKRFEITIAPFATAGIGYGFGGGGAAFDFGFGVEGKFFFLDGLYAFAQPVEIGGWVPGGITYKFGAGIGYAF